MGIALVGSAGAVSVNASAASLTPAFAQATTAGNLLICRVASFNGSNGTTSPGWVNTVVGGRDFASIFYKKNCGAGESPPVITCGLAGFMAADLLEYSGASTTAPLDTSNASHATTTPASASLPSADSGNSELAIAAFAWDNSKSATYTVTDSWSPALGTVSAAQGSTATKNATLAWFSGYLLNGHGGGSADTDTLTVTPSAGVLDLTNGWDGVLATFLPVAHSLVYDARVRRNSLLRR